MTLKQDYQVAIIGGGPSGARSAQLLAQKGISVVLLEAEGPDVDILCSGLLNPEAQQSLAMELPNHVRREPFAPPLEYHDLDNNIRLRYDPRYKNMDRPSFDSWLRELAEEAGAEVRYHQRVRRMSADSNGVELKLKDGTLRAALAIDATGWRALSRRLQGGGKAPHVHAFQGTVEMDLPEESMWAVFEDSVTNYYGWVVPKGNGQFLLGAGFPVGSDSTRDQHDDPWSKLRPFAEHIESLGHSVKITEHKPCGSPITTITNMNQLWWGANGVLPVGEAAGLVSPSSGDGISFCLQSARALADAIERIGIENLRYGNDGLEAGIHQSITHAMLARMKPVTSELRFNIFKAWTASRPVWRGLAARMLPLYLRRPVEKMQFSAAKTAGAKV